jgi:hypothetical protein
MNAQVDKELGLSLEERIDLRKLHSRIQEIQQKSKSDIFTPEAKSRMEKQSSALA